MLNSIEYEKSFITSDPGSTAHTKKNSTALALNGLRRKLDSACAIWAEHNMLRPFCALQLSQERCMFRQFAHA